MEHAAQVDVDHAVELLQRHFLKPRVLGDAGVVDPVSYTHLRAHETVLDLVCRLLLEKKNDKQLNRSYMPLSHSHHSQPVLMSDTT